MATAHPAVVRAKMNNHRIMSLVIGLNIINFAMQAVTISLVYISNVNFNCIHFDSERQKSKALVVRELKTALTLSNFLIIDKVVKCNVWIGGVVDASVWQRN